MSSSNARKPFAILFLVLVGLVLFWVLVAVALMFHPTSRGAIRSISDTATAFAEGMNAPGTAELVAAGCDQAMVLRLGDTLGLGNALLPESKEVTLPPEVQDRPFVFCRIEVATRRAPSCDDVAATYVQAAAPAAVFLAAVHRPGDTVCQSFYAPDGSWIGEAGPSFELRPEGGRE